MFGGIVFRPGRAQQPGQACVECRMLQRGLKRACVLILGVVGFCLAQGALPAPLAHFHHVHLNATDPAAAIQFYTSKFDCEKVEFPGLGDAGDLAYGLKL